MPYRPVLITSENVGSPLR